MKGNSKYADKKCDCYQRAAINNAAIKNNIFLYKFEEREQLQYFGN